MAGLPLLCCAAAGDAVGLPFSSRKPVLRPPGGFTPTPDDHRSDPVRFSRTGTYSWLTQISLAASDSLIDPGPFRRNFLERISKGLKEGPPEYLGIFRNVPEHVRELLAAAESGTPAQACLPYLAVLAPPFFLRYPDLPDRAFEETARTCLIFSDHFLSVTSALSVLAVLYTLRDDANSGPERILRAASVRLAEKEKDLTSRISSSFNLLSLSHERSASGSLALLADAGPGTDEEIEGRISRNASLLSGQNIPRASHPWPLASVLFGITCGLRRRFPEAAFYAASRGGESSLTSFLAAAVASLGNVPDHPGATSLLSLLANRKQIALREECLRTGRRSADLRDLVEMEKDTSLASALELRRHTKHADSGPKGKMEPEEIRKAPVPGLPDRKNKRLWKEYIKQKTKLKKRRRD